MAVIAVSLPALREEEIHGVRSSLATIADKTIAFLTFAFRLAPFVFFVFVEPVFIFFGDVLSATIALHAIAHVYTGVAIFAHFFAGAVAVGVTHIAILRNGVAALLAHSLHKVLNLIIVSALSATEGNHFVRSFVVVRCMWLYTEKTFQFFRVS